MRVLIPLLASLALCACVSPAPIAAPAPVAIPENVPVPVARAIDVTRRMEPVVEALCRRETQRGNCDFDFLVLRDPEAGVNAFQTLHPETGRPMVFFTVGLIRTVRNDDELAFVIGHEAAHHIAGHLDQEQAAAQAGAQIFGTSALEQGASRAEAIAAAEQGARVGSLQFSQGAELEADRLGALITCLAGFDAEIGSRFFTLLPDPDAAILSTHPTNAARIEAVRQTVARGC